MENKNVSCETNLQGARKTEKGMIKCLLVSVKSGVYNTTSQYRRRTKKDKRRVNMGESLSGGGTRSRRNMKGYIQVYTGDGKGKTTAALGLALRAAGAGLKVLVAQFLKQGEYSEIKALKLFEDRIKVRQYGCGRFVRGKPTEEERKAAGRGMEEIRGYIRNGSFDMIVVEEGNVAVMCGLITEEELLDLMENKPEAMELVITGRGATEKVIQKADLVTEMREVKHYFKEGVQARKGIEK